MPLPRIPISVIATVADLLAAHHNSRSKIDTLFVRCKAPGPPPSGNMVEQMKTWLMRADEDPGLDAFALLGCVLEEFMDVITENQDWLNRRTTIQRALTDFGLSYGKGGRIFGGATGPQSRSLEMIVRDRDMTTVNKEIERALATVESDPALAITAACAILGSPLQGLYRRQPFGPS